jgi:hypothetical protein
MAVVCWQLSDARCPAPWVRLTKASLKSNLGTDHHAVSEYRQIEARVEAAAK